VLPPARPRDRHRVCGGLLVWWQRLDEAQRRLEQTEVLGNLGWCEYDLISGKTAWSPGMCRIFERDPAQGPLTRAQQAALIVTDDQGLRELPVVPGYAEATVALEPEDVVVFYTDGLIERRGDTAPEDAVGHLAQTLASIQPQPGHDYLAQLSDLFNQPSVSDDTCVLAMRVMPAG
jgi:hypothetical protein